jgi:hypothetical protein
MYTLYSTTKLIKWSFPVHVADPDPLVRGVDPRIMIRIRNQISRIRNTDLLNSVSSTKVAIVQIFLHFLHDIVFFLIKTSLTKRLNRHKEQHLHTGKRPSLSSLWSFCHTCIGRVLTSLIYAHRNLASARHYCYLLLFIVMHLPLFTFLKLPIPKIKIKYRYNRQF